MTEVIPLLQRGLRADADARRLLLAALIDARAALGITDEFIPAHVSVELAGKIERAIEKATATLSDDDHA